MAVARSIHSDADFGGIMLRRRDILTGVVVVVASQLASSTAGFAQVAASAIDQLKQGIPSVFSADARFTADPEFIDQFLNEELEPRRQFFSRLSVATIDDVRSVLDPAATDIGVTTDEDIQTVSDVEQYIQAIKASNSSEGREGETLIEITLDITVEALGLQFLREALSQLLVEDDLASEIVERIARELEIRDTEAAVRNVIDLVFHILSASTLVAIGRLIVGSSAPQIRKRILIALGVRLVPFVGWTFTSACFAACVFAHRRRLVRAVNR